jgi:hypothetical protein
MKTPGFFESEHLSETTICVICCFRNSKIMNTPDSPTTGSNSPLEDETGDPKVNTSEQDVVTNKDDTESITNNDGLVADTDGITETLSESAPATDLNADNHITNTDSADASGLTENL